MMPAGNLPPPPNILNLGPRNILNLPMPMRWLNEVFKINYKDHALVTLWECPEAWCPKT